MGRLGWIALLWGCGGGAAPPIPPSPPPEAKAIRPPNPGIPVPEIVLSAPWRLDRSDRESVVVRLGDSPHGVRVQIASDGRKRVPGVSPIESGRTLEVDDGNAVWPLIAIGYPEFPLHAVKIEVDGPDLVVRFAGPPLNTISAHPEAPADPVLTWVRLRPRGETWRIVADGLWTMSLPSDGLGTGPTPDPADPDGLTLWSAWGEFALSAPKAKRRIQEGPPRWSLDTRPSLGALEPYPRATITWKTD